MEMENKTRESRQRNSVWDIYIARVKKYREIGIPKASIHKIINEELDHDSSYAGFYMWTRRRGIS